MEESVYRKPAARDRARDSEGPLAIARAMQGFRQRVLASTLLADDAAIFEGLFDQVESLLRVLRGSGGRPIAPTAGALHGSEFEEGLSLVHHLGHHAARRGATPTSQVVFSHALSEAAHEVISAPGEDRLGLVEPVLWEGFAAGVREATERKQLEQLTTALSPYLLIRGLMVWRLAGELGTEEAQEALDRLGRDLFHADAKGLLVSADALSIRGDDTACQVLAADATARMQGAFCVFAGLPPELLGAAARRQIEIGQLTCFATTPEAFDWALSQLGCAIRHTSWLPDLLRVKRTR